jgi:ribosomal protein L40E
MSEDASTVECAKCGRANSREATCCEACEAHLYVNCKTCGAKNPRVAETCAECDRELHREKKKRKQHGSHVDARQSIFPVVGGLFVLLLLIILGIRLLSK